MSARSRQGRPTPRRRLGLAAACAMGVIALAPQLHLWAVRGRAWEGACAIIHPDEPAYLAYVNALADGRPRRSDPYTGRDAQLDASRVESIFSVQFAPAYALALAARVFHVSAHAVFIALAFLAAFASTLALYRLILALFGDEWLAAAGALCVLCFGALARAQKLVELLTGYFTPFFSTPFLRRYLPAAPFPVLFFLCLFAWRALGAGRRRDALLWSAAAGASFACLVYSYFFLWTAALAWLACLAILWLVFRRDDRRRAALVFGIVGLLALASLAPYAVLLSHRAPSTDAAQLLVFTRAPDLLRPPELLGALVVVVLVVAAYRGIVEPRDPVFLFACSLALTPLAVFNQQIITGRSLQPIHYEQFITNYLAPLAAFVAASLLWRARAERADRAEHADSAAHTRRDAQHPHIAARYPRRALAALAALALSWGMFETLWMTRRFAGTNIARDAMLAPARRLRELASDAPDDDARASLVFCADPGVCDVLPSLAPQPILWGWHTPSFPGVTPEENKERLYLQLYYAGVDASEFERLERTIHPYRVSLFGWGRVVAGLASDQKLVTEEDERAEIENYARFAENFDRARAAAQPLSYAVVVTNREGPLANLDRWYERDAGRRAGLFTIYRLRLRP